VPELAAIGIVTRDMGEAVRFYRTLGLDVPDPDGQHLETTLPNGVRLMWDDVDLIKRLNDVWVEPAGHRLALAWECQGATDVDATYRRVLEGGFRGGREPWDAPWGQRYAWVYDPDGNQIDLFAPLQR
jgi:catechol 2,3-dioxygenase-like lactoylglutathione lyase family enzyme